MAYFNHAFQKTFLSTATPPDQVQQDGNKLTSDAY